MRKSFPDRCPKSNRCKHYNDCPHDYYPCSPFYSCFEARKNVLKETPKSVKKNVDKAVAVWWAEKGR